MISLYIRVKNLTPKAYVNIYSYVQNHKYINLNIKLLLPEDIFETAKDYFDIQNLSKCIDARYKGSSSQSKSKFLWKHQVDQLATLSKIWPKNVTMEFVNSRTLEEKDIYQFILAEDKDMDFFMILEDENFGYEVIDSIFSIFRKKVYFGIAFSNYTYLNGSKVSFGTGVVQRSCSNRLVNRLWHKNVGTFLKPNSIDESGLFTMPKHPLPSIAPIHRTELFLPREIYTNLQKGYDHYLNALNQIGSMMKNSASSLRRYDFMLEQVGIVLLEYSNWQKVRAEQFPPKVEALIMSSNLDVELKIRGLALLATSLQYEKDAEYRRFIYRDIAFYKYANPAMDDIVNSNIIEQTLCKIEKEPKKRSLKKRVKQFLKRLV